MKKFLFAVLLFAGLAVATPVAEAGQFARIYNGRGVAYVHKSQLYSPYSHGYRNHRHYRSYAYRGYRPHYYRSYYRPSYVSYPYYSNYGYSNYGYSNYGYGRPYCGHHRPRVSIAFGF